VQPAYNSLPAREEPQNAESISPGLMLSGAALLSTGSAVSRQEGSAAEAIKKELVRALTDSEFAAAEAQQADEDDDSPPPQAAERIDVELDDPEPGSSPVAAEQTVTTVKSNVRQPRMILGPAPQPSESGSHGAPPTAAATAAAPAAQQETGRTQLHQAAPQPRGDDAAPPQRGAGRRPESADTAAKRPAGRRHSPPARPQRSPSEETGGDQIRGSRADQHGVSGPVCWHARACAMWRP